ncbi:hypothetical protein BS17DRAFT_790736 [Gyrodon lividus]|nr:hypothetical protein BS17DRAFT_790736 [Gyrodon lividus]
MESPSPNAPGRPADAFSLACAMFCTGVGSDPRSLRSLRLSDCSLLRHRTGIARVKRSVCLASSCRRRVSQFMGLNIKW